MNAETSAGVAFVIHAEFPLRPGQAEAAMTAARRLRERVLREDRGVVLYQFFIDEPAQTLAIVEAYADESALLDHITASDFTPLFASLDFAAGSIRIHGDPSPALSERLKAFGDFKLYRR